MYCAYPACAELNLRRYTAAHVALAFALLVRASLPATAGTATDFESEPVLDAATLVQPSLLSGPGFSVEPRVEVRGYMGNFTITTSVGRLGADSVEV